MKLKIIYSYISFPSTSSISSYKKLQRKKKKKSVSQYVTSKYYLHICVLLIVIQWKYSAYKSEKIQLYITGSR